MYGLRVHEAALAQGFKAPEPPFISRTPSPTGERFFRGAVEVRPGDTPEVLQRRGMEKAEWPHLPQTAERISTEIVKERKNA